VKRLTIRQLAATIRARWPYLDVEVTQGHASTDRKIGRLRLPGKGRTGSRLIVRNTKGEVLLDHNQAETYRRVSDVVEWMERYANEFHFSVTFKQKDVAQPTHRCPFVPGGAVVDHAKDQCRFCTQTDDDHDAQLFEADEAFEAWYESFDQAKWEDVSVQQAFMAGYLAGRS
jgi:hypothetical protein